MRAERLIGRFSSRFIVILYFLLLIQPFIWRILSPSAWPRFEVDSAIFLGDQTFESFLSSNLVDSVVMTLCFAILNGLLCFILVLPMAELILLLQVRRPVMGQIVHGLVFIPLFFPAMVSLLSLLEFLNFIEFGILSTYRSYLLVLFGQFILSYPYAFKVIYDGMVLEGDEQVNQAMSLGESYFKSWFKIRFPSLFPSLLLAFFFGASASFSDYLANFLLGNSNTTTLNLYLVPLVSSGAQQEASMAGLMALLFILFLNLVFWRNPNAKV